MPDKAALRFQAFQSIFPSTDRYRLAFGGPNDMAKDDARKVLTDVLKRTVSPRLIDRVLVITTLRLDLKNFPF